MDQFLLISFLFILFWNIIYRRFSQEFRKKFVKTTFFFGFFYFHGLYWKPTLTLYILGLLQRNFDNSALNIFKLLFLLYYFVYNYLAKSFIFYFYKEILTGTDEFPIDLILILLKYSNIDVLSIKIMNFLTIPLTSIYSWISFASYLYYLLGLI